VAAAGFHPNQDGYTYNNAGYWLERFSFGGICPACDSSYYAPLHLPHYSTITRLTAYICDQNTLKHGTVDLVEENLSNGSVSTWIAQVNSPDGVNSAFTPYTSSSFSHAVDNQNHAYYLRYTTPI